jgi:hypothetical protein
MDYIMMKRRLEFSKTATQPYKLKTHRNSLFYSDRRHWGSHDGAAAAELFILLSGIVLSISTDGGCRA